jgi:hypothetical protein
MDILLLLIFIAICMFYIGKNNSKLTKKTSAPQKSKNDRIIENNLDKLKGIWDLSAQTPTDGNNIFPAWYFDSPTNRQLDKLYSLGITKNINTLNKGMASDLIGIFEPADPEHIEIIKFFKSESGQLNQTLARHAARQLLSNPENKTQWENRPASAIQKAFCKLAKISIPKNISLSQANDIFKELPTELQEDWENMQSLWSDLQSSDNREDYNLKKVPIKTFIEAISEIVDEDTDMRDISFDELANKIIELNPDLET